MIITRTPFRISFFGGGTDYPSWYRLHGGTVLATSIDKYCYLFCRYLPPFFDHRIVVTYSQIEHRRSIDEVTHPAAREILRYLKFERGISIVYAGDLPSRSGIGSSSSFTVGLLHALHALRGAIPSKRNLIKESIHIEQEVLKEAVGSQDQVLAAVGGFNRVTFHPSGEISIQPLTVSKDRLAELNNHLMLFYTGFSRTASTIVASYLPVIPSRDQDFRRMTSMVEEGMEILASGQDIRGFGRLLHETWEMKQRLSRLVSNSEISAMYETARQAGAIGGKLLGAGGGGFMLLFVPPERQKEVRAKLRNFIRVPFKFESAGSQIIFYDPEEEYDTDEAVQSQPYFKEFIPDQVEEA